MGGTRGGEAACPRKAVMPYRSPRPRARIASRGAILGRAGWIRLDRAGAAQRFDFGRSEAPVGQNGFGVFTRFGRGPLHAAGRAAESRGGRRLNHSVDLDESSARHVVW